MPLEVATHIASLVATNPAGLDDLSTADDHIRLVKQMLLTDIPLTTPATAIGISVLTAVDAPAARTALGSTTTGDAVFIAATAAAARTALGALNIEFLHVRDEKVSGTQGGASAAGNQVRTLNTVVTNTIAGASLATNQVTLPAGTYRIFASAPAIGSNHHRLRLANVTDSTVALLGQNAYSASANVVVTNSAVTGRIVIAATKVFNLTHFINTALASNGLGNQIGDTFVEIYTDMMIWKE